MSDYASFIEDDIPTYIFPKSSNSYQKISRKAAFIQFNEIIMKYYDIFAQKNPNNLFRIRFQDFEKTFKGCNLDHYDKLVKREVYISEPRFDSKYTIYLSMLELIKGYNVRRILSLFPIKQKEFYKSKNRAKRKLTVSKRSQVLDALNEYKLTLHDLNHHKY